MVAIAADPVNQRLQSLIRHVEDVRQDCTILGTRLIARGEPDVGRILISNGFIHDHSKFSGLEWEHLHSQKDPLFAEAWRHHIRHNPHHPEFWGDGGIHRMERTAVAEMICDWHARAAELDGGGLRWWINHEAMRKFKFDSDDEVGKQVKDFVELLLEHWN
jgi:hypothetical protein